MSTLQDLADGLGPGLLTVEIAPAGLDAEFDRVVIFDALEMPSFNPNDLVLAVGVPVETAFMLRLLQGRPAAMLLRHDGALDQRLLSEASACGVAILTAPSSCTWSQLHAITLSLPVKAPADFASPPGGTQLMQDLFSIANALAETVGAPITVEDNQSRLLAYSAMQEHVDEARSATILGHRVPDLYRREIRRLGVIKRLLTETEPFHFVSPAPEIVSRMVVAIRAREEVLGSIWAVADRPFNEAQTAAFSAAANSIAARMLHQRLISDLQRQQAAATLAGLLQGGELGRAIASRQGLVGDCFRLLAVSHRDPGTRDAQLLDQAWTTLATELSLTTERAITARIDETLYCLVAAQSAVAAQRCLDALGKSLGQDALEELVVGVSGHIAALSELPLARDEADRVIEVLRRSGGQAAELSELALPVTLTRIHDLQVERPGSHPRVLDDVVQYDDQHGTKYFETLRVYLSTFGDPSLAAHELDVHTNTLRYRLSRISQIFGLDLTVDDVRFALMLEFRLR